MGPESQRALGFPAPVFAQDGPGSLTSSSWTCRSICSCSLGSIRKAWWCRSVGSLGHGVGVGGHGQAAGRQGEWGLASPPAGIAAAQRTPRHGWARADPGGTGPCRELPRRAGPAETQQGHLGNPRPPTPRSEPHRPPLALTAHAQGGDQASTRAAEGRGGCLGGCRAASQHPSAPRKHSDSYLLRGQVVGCWLDLGSEVERQGVPEAWTRARTRERLLTEQAQPRELRGPQHLASSPTSAAHLFPQQGSRGSGTRATFLIPWPAVARVHWRSAVPAQLRQQAPVASTSPNLPSFPRGNSAAYRAAPLRTPAAEVRPSGRGGRLGAHAKQAWGLLSWSPKAQPPADTPCLVEWVSLGLEEQRMAGVGAREGGASERLRSQT